MEPAQRAVFIAETNPSQISIIKAAKTDINTGGSMNVF